MPEWLFVACLRFGQGDASDPNSKLPLSKYFVYEVINLGGGGAGREARRKTNVWEKTQM